jgi:phosphate transport system substrate-binding protein
MRQAGRLTIWATLLAGAAAGCHQGSAAPGRSLVITGSYSMTPLVKEIAGRFEGSHAGVRIEVQAVGTTRGVSDARQGLADVGMAARALRPDEAANLYAGTIARDGICIVVPRSNPVADLTDAQVTTLFVRITTNWKDVRAPEGPVTVVGLNENRALNQAFLERFKLKIGQVRYDVTAGDARQALEAVARDPLAVGFATIGQAAEAAPTLGLRLVPFNGVPATTANVANGTYAFVRPLVLVTREPPQELAREFIEFARSPAVRDLIEKYHEVPPAP